MWIFVETTFCTHGQTLLIERTAASDLWISSVGLVRKENLAKNEVKGKQKKEGREKVKEKSEEGGEADK